MTTASRSEFPGQSNQEMPLIKSYDHTIMGALMRPLSGIDELYSLAHGGDADARESLYARLLVSFRVVIRHRMWGDEDAEDVAQDALLAVAGQFDELTIESSFAAWAYRVLNNKIADHFKLKKIRTGKIEQLRQQRTEAVVTDSNPVLKMKIKDCFEKIHRKHRQHARILSLRFQGYTTDEICQRLGITRNNCWVTLSRARAMLEKCLNQEGEEP